jgi:hypothetical protein
MLLLSLTFDEDTVPTEYRTPGGIQIQSYAGPDHLISGLCVRFASLDRFIAIKNIFLLLQKGLG